MSCLDHAPHAPHVAWILPSPISCEAELVPGSSGSSWIILDHPGSQLHSDNDGGQLLIICWTTLKVPCYSFQLRRRAIRPVKSAMLRMSRSLAVKLCQTLCQTFDRYKQTYNLKTGVVRSCELRYDMPPGITSTTGPQVQPGFSIHPYPRDCKGESSVFMGFSMIFHDFP